MNSPARNVTASSKRAARGSNAVRQKDRLLMRRESLMCRQGKRPARKNRLRKTTGRSSKKGKPKDKETEAPLRGMKSFFIIPIQGSRFV